ncbi:MAG: hypothetical protein P0Y48_01415 [Candidatus Microbacterium phytovorans]|uniref:Uncharacterized protein n=1 Tax=Candidatus Microbacterium phytovorans TaxID=3121374 RepID=A0AAJ5W101_9MICO|nr:hypothetical protein [Microbacterium sp.]WEK13899.1 MAG: hypothetical protein P0Y48_01415 [Microbacterium sp.]
MNEAGPSIIDLIVLGATLATAAFTGWAVYQRWRYTPRPFWKEPVVWGVSFSGEGTDQMRSIVTWSIENRGDASAYDVAIGVAIRGARWNPQPGAAQVGPSGEVQVSIGTPASGDNGYESGEYIDTRTVLWHPHLVRVQWRQHPNLGRLRRKSWQLPDPNEGSGVRNLGGPGT